jgi:hypothetical protein
MYYYAHCELHETKNHGASESLNSEGTVAAVIIQRRHVY